MSVSESKKKLMKERLKWLEDRAKYQRNAETNSRRFAEHFEECAARLRSELYIAEVGMRLEDVDVPSPMTLDSEYQDWVMHMCVASQKDLKPYTEWNGKIYRTEDIAAGKWEATPARMSELRGRAVDGGEGAR